MALKYSDQEIASLIKEAKPMPDDYMKRLVLRNKRGHKERELEIKGAARNEYCIILRQSYFNLHDFSIIFAVQPKDTTQLFRLRRYNGKSHEHTNQIEQNTFYDFHIHMATERYQDLGIREDAFAEPTDRFSDFHSALRCMLDDCGFLVPKDNNKNLFEEI